jgi:uncharacterized membrane protein
MALIGLGLGTEGSLYRLVLLLHIACAAIGFGAVSFNALVRSRARQHDGDVEFILLEDNAAIGHIAEFFMYGVLIFGLLVALTSQNTWQLNQSWLSLSMLLYLIELGLLHGIIHRAEREYRVLLRQVNNGGERDQSADIAQLEHLEQRVALGWAGFDVIFLVILYLMVFTPGHIRVG